MSSLPPTLMDNIQYEAIRTMFYKYRAQPQVPEHARVIEAELAALQKLDKNDYKNYKDFYDRTKKEAEERAKAVQEEEEYQKKAGFEQAKAEMIESLTGKIKEKEVEKAVEEKIERKEPDGEVKTEAPKEAPNQEEELKLEKLPEIVFRTLSADKQKELVKDLIKKEGDDSNLEKRLKLYYS